MSDDRTGRMLRLWRYTFRAYAIPALLCGGSFVMIWAGLAGIGGDGVLATMRAVTIVLTAAAAAVWMIARSLSRTENGDE